MVATRLSGCYGYQAQLQPRTYSRAVEPLTSRNPNQGELDVDLVAAIRLRAP